MSVTVINDCDFKPDGGVSEAKSVAAELVEYFKAAVPGVQLSRWLEDRDNPLHHYHVTVFDSVAALVQIRESEAIKRFVDRLFPHIAHSTYKSPVTDVWLADGSGGLSLLPIRNARCLVKVPWKPTLLLARW